MRSEARSVPIIGKMSTFIMSNAPCEYLRGLHLYSQQFFSCPSFPHLQERTEEIYRDGGRRTAGVIVAFFVVKLIACSSIIETTLEVHRNGVGGAYFNAIAACVVITLIAPMTVELKTKAPGARTFLQVVRARFGTPVHCLFCVCALFVNVGMSMQICSKSDSAQP
ncbi:putative urea active transporter 1 [Taenia solium]|eukprot:TsM_000202600 transcript=TsM_000202600 gene=TsM_000202600